MPQSLDDLAVPGTTGDLPSVTSGAPLTDGATPTPEAPLPPATADPYPSASQSLSPTPTPTPEPYPAAVDPTVPAAYPDTPAPYPADPAAAAPYPTDAEPVTPAAGPATGEQPWWSQTGPPLPGVDVTGAIDPPQPPVAPRGAGRPVPAAPEVAAPQPVDDWFEATEQPEPEVAPQATAVADPVPEPSSSSLPPLKSPTRPGIAPATVSVQERKAPARRGVSRLAALLVLLPILLVLIAAFFVFEPFKGEGSGAVQVKIAPGSSVDEIGKLLQQKGVISNGTIFAIRARLSGAGGDLRAGTLDLREGMSYGAALTALQRDPLPAPVIRVGIPEGLSRRETAATVKAAGVRGNYLEASARSAGFDPQRYGQPKAQSGLEGFLFPATYELPRGGATAGALVTEQLKKFTSEISTVSMARARKAKLSRYDVLIIASMIEREVRIPAERKLVAAVIYNRLKQDMPLGIDATIRYAERNWTRPLRVSELQRNGPYNTRMRTGLPPTPIGNPGLASIEAAAKPAKVSYLYYVVKPCGNGRHAFSSTDAKFAKDQAAYAAAQRKAGGDPSVCKKK